ncbi:hypothetical protein QQS21_001882 [Conoideocrella luteorostrata]|uniref:AAA+ ATPase domain-containing protein n=1 Tax=Conoideocrella luteorostrata TaxID=1105319 RepID=A0AAJ0CW93_9HYPO|nr:hypothetical protein QQS21_001882 [Conoideocrella luteorostrata]
MLRNKTFAALQKTYDDSYLSCSTAVYYESQGAEVEATRHWKHALEQIYEHRATKATPGYGPQNDTEKALTEALKQLELQCKERIDLLEALRVSRREGSPSIPTTKASKSPTRNMNSSDNHSKGSIGQGTIPAVAYSELSRPTLPSRPLLPVRASSSQTNPSNASGSGHNYEADPTFTAKSRSKSPNLPIRSDKTLRSPSPEKHTMRTTLRSGRFNDKSNKATRKSHKPAAEGPSKAATLAWSALGSRDRQFNASSQNGASSTSQLVSRQNIDQARPIFPPLQWDSHSRRLMTSREIENCVNGQPTTISRHSDEYPQSTSSHLSVSAASSALNSLSQQDLPVDQSSNRYERVSSARIGVAVGPGSKAIQDNKADGFSPVDDSGDTSERKNVSDSPVRRKAIAKRPVQSSLSSSKNSNKEQSRDARHQGRQNLSQLENNSSGSEDVKFQTSSGIRSTKSKERTGKPGVHFMSSNDTSSDDSSSDSTWNNRKASILKNLPPGVDEGAAKQILNDIVVQGDEVRWGDIAGLEIAKNALRETVVYPFLRPDLFMGLREPARGMLLFGPPGTGKTMLARAVATESKSTFFSISASSLTSKYLGESEKLVRALFGLARSLAPSIIFVDEIDSLLSQRSGSGEHEATRRIKTEFLIQWSDLQRAAAGRETTDRDKERGDANRVLVLAATNLPWAIDEAARRRFVRRQYIPLPEPHTRETQLRTLLGQQKHGLSAADIERLVGLTDGFSGSDITALAKDAAMGPLRSLGEALLHMTMDDIRPIILLDFEASLGMIRPSVSRTGLKEYEDWAREFGERGG